MRLKIYKIAINFKQVNTEVALSTAAGQNHVGKGDGKSGSRQLYFCVTNKTKNDCQCDN